MLKKKIKTPNILSVLFIFFLSIQAKYIQCLHHIMSGLIYDKL